MVYARRQEEEADALQAGIVRFRQAMAGFPMIPALKAVIGIHTGGA